MYGYKIKLKFNYLLGHRRALCPGCQHAPQSRERFAGGRRSRSTPASRTWSPVQFHPPVLLVALRSLTLTRSPPRPSPLDHLFRSSCTFLPKHQSGLNFVWSGMMNESVISLCWPVITLQRRYCTKIAFLFPPPQFSACRCTLSSPSPWFSKKWWSMLTMALEPFPCRQLHR